MLDNCDNAGVIEADLELASQEIGLAKGKLTLSGFGDRVALLPSGKHWITKFIEFQYGNLSEKSPAHRSVLKLIEKHSLDGYGYPSGRVTVTLQDKDKDKDKDLCTLVQAKSQAPIARMTEDEAEYWWHSRKKAGWVMGAAGGGSRKIVSWQSDMQTSANWVREMLAKEKQAGKTEGRGW